MTVGYELLVGLRHFKAKRKEAFISLTTAISIIGVMVGVMALIVVLSVMKGFERDLRDKILGANAHIVVMRPGGEMVDYLQVMETIEEIDGVTGTSPFIYSQVMLSSGLRTTGVVLKGIDVERVGRVNVLPDRLVEGDLDGLRRDGPGILIGEELARELGVWVGDRVEVMSPSGVFTPYGIMPLKTGLVVKGIFKFGMYEYDSSLTFTSLDTAQAIAGMDGRVTGVEVRVEDLFATSGIVERIRSALKERLDPFYTVRDWMEMNRNLFAALKLERITMFIILTLIVLVAAFNIVGTLIMTVMERSKEIAILRAMGATRKGIMKIFMIEGAIIGVTGTLLGTVGGLVIDILLARYRLIRLPQDVYYIEFLPVAIDPLIFIAVTMASFAITFLATIYPAWKASSINITEAIRYE